MPWEHGSVLRTPSAIDFWDANTVRVETPGVAAEVMEAAADEFLADCGHRKLDVEDEATGDAVRPYFAARGWMHERHAMLRRAGPPPAARPYTVEEVRLSSTRALRVEWSDDGDEAFAVRQEPVLARRGVRAFMAGDEGFLTLAIGEDAVEIDSLYVTPSARDRGLGTALIAAALAAGAKEVAWIVADDEGRARPLYERVGFETVWRFFNFVRKPQP